MVPLFATASVVTSQAALPAVLNLTVVVAVIVLGRLLLRPLLRLVAETRAQQQPPRLWAMRAKIFGTGGLQVVLTTLALSAVLWLAGFALGFVLLVGAMLALSSTAFVLQILEEKGEQTYHPLLIKSPYR